MPEICDMALSINSTLFILRAAYLVTNINNELESTENFAKNYSRKSNFKSIKCFCYERIAICINEVSISSKDHFVTNL